LHVTFHRGRRYLQQATFAGLLTASAHATLAQPVPGPWPDDSRQLDHKPAASRPFESNPSSPGPAPFGSRRTRPSDYPAMTFVVARGDENACGPGCREWIAAGGRIDVGAAHRLHTVVSGLGGRKLPVFLHSPGGSVDAALALGRMIRIQELATGVGRTVLAGCDANNPFDWGCDALKRSGGDLAAQLDPVNVMCNSACVLALAGGTARTVPPWAKLGVHAVGLDLENKSLSDAGAAQFTRAANARIVAYLRAMRIDTALFDAADAIPYASVRFLERDELARFGIDTREFGETGWWFAHMPFAAVTKRFFVRTDNKSAGDGKEKSAYSNALVGLSCGSDGSRRLTFARDQRDQRVGLGAGARPIYLSINSHRMELSYATDAVFDVRMVRLSADILDTATDRSAFAFEDFDAAARDATPRTVTLSMDGFSAAYAKLRKACVEPAANNN
jgi:hypothetical protein